MRNLKIDYKDGFLQISLNRPEKRNALNQEIIDELIEAFKSAEKDNDISLINIKGEGKLFCAGADIEWMKELGNSSEVKIQERFTKLAYMLELLHRLPQITICTVNGAAYGGGIGLMSACDIAVAETGTTFSFSEINLGLVPATISPFIVNKVGSQIFKKLFVTGEKFNELYAKQIGLIDDVVIEQQVFIEKIITKPKEALKAMKVLFKTLHTGEISITNYTNSTKLISKLIKSDETQSIFQDFLK